MRKIAYLLQIFQLEFAVPEVETSVDPSSTLSHQRFQCDGQCTNGYQSIAGRGRAEVDGVKGAKYVAAERNLTMGVEHTM